MKYDPATVLYMPPKVLTPVGSPDRMSPAGARCGGCQMFMPATSECTILDPAKVDGKHGVCNLFVGGAPMGEAATRVVPAAVAGYIGTGAPTRCGSCDFFLPEGNACKIVSGRIEALGCCNAWQSKSQGA